MDNFVVTIARGYGSGGKVIAMKLAEQLGISIYEHRILALASEYSGYEEGKLVPFDERVNGSYLSKKLTQIASEYGIHPMTREFKQNQRIFDIQKRIIQDLADSESCVIVGKCADDILKNRKNVLSVYIEAPRPYCRARIMKKQNVSAEEADKLITTTDKYRAEYYRYYTGGNYWTNPVNYDITLNSERVGEDNCVETIIALLKIKGLYPLPEQREEK